MAWGGWFSDPILLGTAVVATSLYSPRALPFSLVANKILKRFFGSAKGQEWGFVFVGLGDARYFFFVRVISLCLNAEGAPPRHAPRRLMAKEFATTTRKKNTEDS